VVLPELSKFDVTVSVVFAVIVIAIEPLCVPSFTFEKASASVGYEPVVEPKVAVILTWAFM